MPVLSIFCILIFQIPYHIPRLTEDEMVARSRDFYQLMNTRRTVRFFSSDPVPREVVDNIVRTAGMRIIPLVWIWSLYDGDPPKRWRCDVDAVGNLEFGCSSIPTQHGCHMCRHYWWWVFSNWMSVFLGEGGVKEVVILASIIVIIVILFIASWLASQYSLLGLVSVSCSNLE